MKVVITGITGQDGSLMADFLLKNTDALVFGVVRQLSVPNHSNIKHLKGNPRVKLVEGDITCPHSMSGIVKSIKPDYFINFAANSFVGTSWKNPTQVFETNAMAVLHQLEAIRTNHPSCRFYQAGSSEEFGDIQYNPQDETHPLRPRSPYGAAKASARHLVKVYRESYGLYAVCGWLFNHEGIRRGEQFVTRKITKGVARIAEAVRRFEKGPEGISSLSLVFDPLILGNLEARRDWSDAEDFVEGVWRMLNQPEYNPSAFRDGQISKHIKDYVLASGETHSVREFIIHAFNAANVRIVHVNEDMRIPSEGGDIVEYTLENGVPVVVVSKDLYRPAEVDVLLGNSSKARAALGWMPKTSFKSLVTKMVKNDMFNLPG